MKHDQLRQIAEYLQAPAWITDKLPLFYTEEVLNMLLNMPDTPDFSQYSNEELFSLYHRGILSRSGDGTYTVSSFLSHLEVLLIDDPAFLQGLSLTERNDLREWFFADYYASEPEKQDTVDRTVPLEEMLEIIDQEERTFYLCSCECRQFGGECGKPIGTCLSFDSGYNSFADRKIAVPVSKAKARQVILNGDRDGLIHTVNGMGYCQCCSDCCCMFRYTRKHHLEGIWPRAEYIISCDAQKCTSCGRCSSRCQFDVFRFDNGTRTINREYCVGCGLCTSTCPTGALKLIPRSMH